MSKLDEDRPESLNLAIDRLVDGSLDETGRRDLLLKLEDDPDGWRRCALAFLEDQAWRGALGVPVAPASIVPVATVPTRARWAGPGRLAVAASALAATFAAGFASGGASRGASPVSIATAPATAPKNQPILTPVLAPAPAVREVGWIDLVDGEGGESPPSRLPILAGPGLDERWLRQQPPSVPAYLRAQWERKGYQVDERRRLVSLDLEDGRRVAIPVDEVNVEFVGQDPL